MDIPAPDRCASGTYHPTDNDSGAADGRSPRRLPNPAATALSTFNGANPNGVWQLFVVDDARGDSWGGRRRVVPQRQHRRAHDDRAHLVGQPVDVRPGGHVHGDRHQRRPVNAGTVTFKDGATTLGERDGQRLRRGDVHHLDARASLHTPITATYNGTSAFQASTSTALTPGRATGTDVDRADVVAEPVDLR